MRTNHKGARNHILERMENELDSRYTYHDIAHSRTNVMNMAIQFGKASNLDSHSMALIKTAVAYHDSGFLMRHNDHELGGILIAEETLPKFGYKAEDIKVITGMILATRLPQTPQTYLEAILADADLSVLGRTDFFGRDRDLRRELLSFGTKYSDREWYEVQIRFLEAHTYHTFVAKLIGNKQKAENISQLKKRLERIKKRELV